MPFSDLIESASANARTTRSDRISVTATQYVFVLHSLEIKAPATISDTDASMDGGSKRRAVRRINTKRRAVPRRCSNDRH